MNSNDSTRNQFAGPAMVAPESNDTPPQIDSGPAQIADNGQDSGQAPGSTPTTGEERFADYNEAELTPAELARVKQFQADYTRKTQALSQRQKEMQNVEQLARVAHNFQTSPYSPDIQNYLRQYGYVLENQGQGGQGEQQADWTPQTWDEVISRARSEAKQEVMRELAPVFGSVQEMQARTVEAELAKIDPQWRDFEPQMMSLLQEVPGLAKFPQRLYRLAVPPEVQEAKAMQAALAKLEGKGKHAAVAVKQGVSRSKPSPAKPKNFEEAWALAANQINQEG